MSKTTASAAGGAMPADGYRQFRDHIRRRCAEARERAHRGVAQDDDADLFVVYDLLFETKFDIESNTTGVVFARTFSAALN